MSARRRIVSSQTAALGGLAAAMMLAVACGLDEGGGPTDAGLDVTLPDSGDAGNDVISDVLVFPDVPVPDVVVPPTCQTMDASCIPSYPADAGWQPVAVGTSAATCPDPDAGFQTLAFVSDAVLKAGACGCGCALKGNLACGPNFNVAYWNSQNCGAGGPNNLSVPKNGCSNQGFNAGSVRVNGGTPSGVSCTASQTGDAGFDTTAVSVCAPTACTSDYCGLASAGFKLCIVKDGDQPTCPSGFGAPRSIGATASSACLGCGCAVTGATCGGTMNDYGSKCNTGQLIESIPADGGCYPVQAAQHLDFTAQNGTPQCNASDGGGAATLVGRKTVCCAP